MLLLVIDAELDQLTYGGMAPADCGLEQRLEPGIDVVSVTQNIFEARAREDPALGTRLARPCRLVVGIEAIRKALIERAEARKMRLQHEGLEEPGGVGEVPFGGARIVHGLDDLVFRTEGLR